MNASTAFSSPALLAQPLVVRRVPRLADHRLAVESLDQHAALVVHREVHRADHPVAAALAEPVRRRVEQGPRRLRVVLQLEEAEHPPGVVVEVVERGVDLGADPAHHAAVAARQEQLRLTVLEERVEARAEEQPALYPQRGNPLFLVSMQPERKLYELAHIAARGDGLHLD